MEFNSESLFFEALESHKRCKYCGGIEGTCLCSGALVSKIRSVYQICEVPLKKKKWVTIVKGSFSEEDFKHLKDHLGTGGTFTQTEVALRGRLTKRLLILLKELNYRFEGNVDKL